ncbi:hypothetical protein ARMGADRAFT_1067491 [Armillaria gallica]|uniref:Uncharacterized protein n=1 Tax=Armillaria gallica TaxID=47427 RepID=A0A2H3CQT1_ARMGA|nr:hypothetical protein ARMGADRAFT_1067491 [Armillaria gallica]
MDRIKTPSQSDSHVFIALSHSRRRRIYIFVSTPNLNAAVTVGRLVAISRRQVPVPVPGEVMVVAAAPSAKGRVLSLATYLHLALPLLKMRLAFPIVGQWPDDGHGKSSVSAMTDRNDYENGYSYPNIVELGIYLTSFCPPAGNLRSLSGLGPETHFGLHYALAIFISGFYAP